MRKKLLLDLDGLQVESFGTSEGPGDARGTVHGNSDSGFTSKCATDYHCTNLSGCCLTDGASCYGGCSDSGCGQSLCPIE